MHELSKAAYGSARPGGNIYDKYGSGNPITKYLMAGFFAALDESLPDQVETVLEVGVGEGEVLHRLVGRFNPRLAVGIDLPGGRLRPHWIDRDLRGLEASGESLPFADKSFDLVVGLEMLEHVTNPERVLGEIVRVAAGRVVLSVPREPLWRLMNMGRFTYLSAWGNTPGHIHHWSSKQFTELVSGYLSVTQVRRPLPWVMVAGRPR